MKGLLLLSIFTIVIYYAILSASYYEAPIKPTTTPDVDIIAKFIKKNTSKNDVIMDLVNNGDFLSLLRKSERKIFVINKFVPTTSALLYEWYKRNKILEEVRKNPAYIEEVCKQYQIDFVVSRQEIKSSHYQEVFSHNHYFIYQVNCQHALGELIFSNRNLINTVHQSPNH